MRAAVSQAMTRRIRSNPAEFICALWRDNSRRFSSVVRDRISEADKKELAEILSAETDDPYQHYDRVQRRAGTILQETLPRSLLEGLRGFGKEGRSILLLKNCPIVGNGRNLPAIPTSSQRSKEKDFVSEWFMLGISDLIGAIPYRLKNVRDGEVITQLIPTDPTSRSGSGSLVPLNLHNEVVHQELVPCSFEILTLIGNPSAKTTYCFLEDIIRFLPPQILEELQKPNFLMRSGDKKVFKEAQEIVCPIITIDKHGEYKIRFNTSPGRCEGITDEAKIAIDYLNQILRRDVPIHGVALQDGELMVVSNSDTLHGRTEFTGNRWVQRMNLRDASSQDGSNQR